MKGGLSKSYSERNFQSKMKFNGLYFIQFCIKCNKIWLKQQIIHVTKHGNHKAWTSLNTVRQKFSIIGKLVKIGKAVHKNILFHMENIASYTCTNRCHAYLPATRIVRGRTFSGDTLMYQNHKFVTGLLKISLWLTERCSQNAANYWNVAIPPKQTTIARRFGINQSQVSRLIAK